MNLAELKKLAMSATPGPWVVGEWTIFDSDREAQNRREPFWTLIKSRCTSSICAGPIGRKSLDIDGVVRGAGHDESDLIAAENDLQFIAAANPDTVLKLLEIAEWAERAKKDLEFYASEWGNQFGMATWTNERIKKILDQSCSTAKDCLAAYPKGANEKP